MYGLNIAYEHNSSIVNEVIRTIPNFFKKRFYIEENTK